MNNIKEYRRHFREILPRLLEVDFLTVPKRLVFKQIDKERFEIFKQLPYYMSDGIMLLNKSFPQYELMRNFMIVLWAADRETLLQAYKETQEKYGNIGWEDVCNETDEKKQEQMIFNLLIPDVMWCKDMKK